MFRNLSHLGGLLVIALLFTAACQPIQPTNARAGEATNTRQANQALVQRFYDEVFTQKKMAVLGEIFAENFVAHDLDDQELPAGLEETLVAFPDIKATVNQWVIEGELVTAIVAYQGTHQAEFLGVAPTGKVVTFAIVDVWRVQDGVITELWHDIPNEEILEQIQPQDNAQALKPGDKIGTMTLSAGPLPFDLAAIPPFPAFCDPTPALKSTDTEGKPGAYIVECTVPPLPKLHIGGGWIAADEALRDADWNAQHKEVYVNGQLIDETAFGSVDADVPVLALPGQAADEVQMVKLRVWNIVLENLTPGEFILHHVMRLDKPLAQGQATMPAGVYDYTYKITVDANAVAPQGAPAPVKITSDTMVPTQSVPFTGTVEAVETYDVKPPTMLVDTTGSGESNELGHFTVTWEFTVNLDTGAGVGSAHFIAANGDSLDTTSLGQGDPTGKPDENRVVEQHTITGGTGRFAGTTGTFTLDRLVNTKTGVTSGSFDGSIVLQKAK